MALWEDYMQLRAGLRVSPEPTEEPCVVVSTCNSSALELSSQLVSSRVSENLLSET